MDRKLPLVGARLLCVPLAALLVAAIASAEPGLVRESGGENDSKTLFEYGETVEKTDPTIASDWESSADCEARVASAGGNTQAASGKASSVTAIGEDCRTSCKAYPAPEGHQWFGKAPSCTGRKLNKKKQAYRDCVDLGGEAVDWSYCGDGDPCLTGNKILCKMPKTEAFESMVGFEGDVTWFGTAPACNANKGEEDCKALGGTVAARGRCTDGSGGRDVTCCTTGKMVACVIPHSVKGEGNEDSYVRWLGTPPACNADHNESECRILSGTVVTKDRCSDGSDGSKKKCCVTGKMVKCLVPKITE